ncbi:MAG: SDR family NAD(P)-dependent oxidoreductase [Pseudomonadota bacterium]
MLKVGAAAPGDENGVPVISGHALITGASSGIGEAFARRLATSCDRLVLVARRGERLQTLAAELGRDCSIEILTADLTSVEGQARVVEAIRQGPALDLLVNNAGFSTLNSFATSVLDAELAMLRLHDDATLALTRAALPAMMDCGRGAVINVSSVAAALCLPTVASYAATKAFLLSFSRSLHAELADSGVGVQCLCPGYTRTEIHSRDSFAGFDVSRVPDEMWMEPMAVVDESLAALADRDVWLVAPGEHNRKLMRDSLTALVSALDAPAPEGSGGD